MDLLFLSLKLETGFKERTLWFKKCDVWPNEGRLKVRHPHALNKDFSLMIWSGLVFFLQLKCLFSLCDLFSVMSAFIWAITSPNGPSPSRWLRRYRPVRTMEGHLRGDVKNWREKEDE